MWTGGYRSGELFIGFQLNGANALQQTELALCGDETDGIGERQRGPRIDALCLHRRDRAAKAAGLKSLPAIHNQFH
ncbi:hypothetical protein MACH15_16260 [Maricaulis maris]|nr:hypothetical protein MACH15_16260 [Maricaulis maris]